MRRPRGAAPVTDAGPDRAARPRPAHAGPPAADEEPLPPRNPPRTAPTPLRSPAPARTDDPFRSLAPRSVRARVICLLMVPVVSLIALWGFATVTTAQNVDALVRLKHVDATLLTPVAATVGALQGERTAAAVYAAAPDPARASAFATASAATDRTMSVLDGDLQVGAADNAGLSAALPSRLDALGTATDGLTALRHQVTGRSADWQSVVSGYGTVIDAAFGVDGALTEVQQQAVQSTAAASDARVLLELARADDLLAREDTAEQAAQAAGRMSQQQYQEFTGALYARRGLVAGAVDDLRPADQDAYTAVLNGSQAKALAQLEAVVKAEGPGTGPVRQIPADSWTGTAHAVQAQLAAFGTAAGAAATAGANPYSAGFLSKNGAAMLFGLLAVIVSLVVSVRIGRDLVQELVGLRNSALDLALRRLPDALARLRAGGDVDVETEAPQVRAGSDELAQVSEALGTVHRAALRAAVERAGVARVLVNLARRSQVLVHRQLSLLDGMERATDDPAELEGLFRLDHLTTQMRRHAEGVIILSGAVPGRAWRRAVPLLDVVRSAVAEVEDFARVEVRDLPGASVAGKAVADLTHLVAELVENATSFSPPHTKVVVSGEQVGTGYVLEVEDRGLGMGRDAVSEANRRIADARQADLFDTDQFGLFVISRLAKRHDIQVSLRTSAYGGTTAVVLLPNALLEEPGQNRRGRAEPSARERAEATGAGGAHGRSGRFAPAGADPADGETAEAVSAGVGAAGARPGGRGGGGTGAGGTGRVGLAPDGAGPGGRGPGRAVPGVPTPMPVRKLAPEPEPAAEPEPSRPTDGGRRDRTPPAAVSDRTGTAPAAAGPAAGEDELPHRVRQASLATQLREAPKDRQDRGGAPAGGTARSPEGARATMTALAEGWARGRNSPGQQQGTPPRRHLRIQQESETADARDDELLR
ncbi:sensor histidine kinase [Streptacidiphilus carbonis]|uniref:sensor histidine kinase n=1 Tax=Streptacidiphilus carbonis TaxID=105422 RepID=UPI0006938A2F|nr:nitrate- and nitrite sensing domain-containing protein [Streptacidiphilus carbonis]